MAPGSCRYFKIIWFYVLWNKFMSTCCETVLRWMSHNTTDDKSTLAQVMAWCRQASSHDLSQCWPRCMLTYFVTRPQWVNSKFNPFIKDSDTHCWPTDVPLAPLSSLRHWKPSKILNSLWPSDTLWCQRSGSTLAQVMACCLMAASQYLNQCWLIISEVQWHSY